MTPARRLLGYFARYKRELIIGAVCVLFSVGFSLLKPLIIRGAVDEVTRDLSVQVLWTFGGMFVGAAVIEGIFLYLQRRIIIGVSRKMEYDMRNDFFAHLQALPLRFYQHQRTGDLMSRATNDLSSVRMLIGPAVMHAFASLLVVSGAFVMMLRIDVQLAMIALAAVPVVAGAVKFFGQRIHVRFKAVQDHFGDISARVQENLAGVRVVRAFGQEENELTTFRQMNREYVERNRSLIKLTATFYPLLHCVIGLLFVLVFFLGTRKILSGTLTIGSFVAFQFYLARMIWPLIALGWVINLFQRGMASMKRLTEIWNTEPDQQRDEGVSGPLDPTIDIRGLTFAYEEREVLQDIHMTVAAGETIGIVGRTGSGKSTLLALIARLYEPPAGTIRIGDVPVEKIAPTALREMIGMVPQETFLFSDSVAENIRFGRGDAETDEVLRVAELAGLGDDVQSFPQGIETVVGERGITLSGGQKQRTAIARAIIRNPAILMLDDALSAVDTQTEERILRSLREVRQGRTVLIVSHRVSSVKDADAIIVLEDGRIVERGSHDELVSRDGYYAELYRQQALEEEIEEIA
jgi:ATP-binding cassette subfamily B multidrug efflux pump